MGDKNPSITVADNTIYTSNSGSKGTSDDLQYKGWFDVRTGWEPAREFWGLDPSLFITTPALQKKSDFQGLIYNMTYEYKKGESNDFDIIHDLSVYTNYQLSGNRFCFQNRQGQGINLKGEIFLDTNFPVFLSDTMYDILDYTNRSSRIDINSITLSGYYKNTKSDPISKTKKLTLTNEQITTLNNGNAIHFTFYVDNCNEYIKFNLTQRIMISVSIKNFDYSTIKNNDNTIHIKQTKTLLSNYKYFFTNNQSFNKNALDLKQEFKNFLESTSLLNTYFEVINDDEETYNKFDEFSIGFPTWFYDDKCFYRTPSLYINTTKDICIEISDRFPMALNTNWVIIKKSNLKKTQITEFENVLDNYNNRFLLAGDENLQNFNFGGYIPESFFDISKPFWKNDDDDNDFQPNLGVIYNIPFQGSIKIVGTSPCAVLDNSVFHNWWAFGAQPVVDDSQLWLYNSKNISQQIIKNTTPSVVITTNIDKRSLWNLRTFSGNLQCSDNNRLGKTFRLDNFRDPNDVLKLDFLGFLLACEGWCNAEMFGCISRKADKKTKSITINNIQIMTHISRGRSPLQCNGYNLNQTYRPPKESLLVNSNIYIDGLIKYLNEEDSLYQRIKPTSVGVSWLENPIVAYTNCNVTNNFVAQADGMDCLTKNTMYNNNQLHSTDDSIKVTSSNSTYENNTVYQGSGGGALCIACWGLSMTDLKNISIDGLYIHKVCQPINYSGNANDTLLNSQSYIPGSILSQNNLYSINDSIQWYNKPSMALCNIMLGNRGIGINGINIEKFYLPNDDTIKTGSQYRWFCLAGFHNFWPLGVPQEAPTLSLKHRHLGTIIEGIKFSDGKISLPSYGNDHIIGLFNYLVSDVSEASGGGSKWGCGPASPGGIKPNLLPNLLPGNGFKTDTYKQNTVWFNFEFSFEYLNRPIQGHNIQFQSQYPNPIEPQALYALCNCNSNNMIDNESNNSNNMIYNESNNKKNLTINISEDSSVYLTLN